MAHFLGVMSTGAVRGRHTGVGMDAVREPFGTRHRHRMRPVDQGMDAMILLSRLNGSTLGVNADLIERVESIPDTVLTLIDGTKFVIAEPADEVVARIIEFRARVLAAADGYAGRDGSRPAPLQLVHDRAAIEEG